MNFGKMAEVSRLNSELVTKLRDLYVDFSNYGPAESDSLLKQMDEARELMEKLAKLFSEV